MNKKQKVWVTFCGAFFALLAVYILVLGGSIQSGGRNFGLIQSTKNKWDGVYKAKNLEYKIASVKQNGSLDDDSEASGYNSEGRISTTESELSSKASNENEKNSNEKDIESTSGDKEGVENKGIQNVVENQNSVKNNSNESGNRGKNNSEKESNQSNSESNESTGETLLPDEKPFLPNPKGVTLDKVAPLYLKPNQYQGNIESFNPDKGWLVIKSIYNNQLITFLVDETSCTLINPDGKIGDYHEDFFFGRSVKITKQAESTSEPFYAVVIEFLN